MGAESVSFRVWAPRRKRVAVVENGDSSAEFKLGAEGNGYFSGTRAGMRAGALYGFRLDDEARVYPDPASRFQPRGHEGLSQVIDPDRFEWSGELRKGVDSRNRIVYEMHIGTFTPEGTWRSAVPHLPWLADLGVTVLEIMPVCEFPGRFGWGYDLVHYFAPTHLYGTPDDMRAFIDGAHRAGLSVILDVVYNHCGTSGCFLPAFAPYFSTRYKNDWGHAINFDGEDAAGVREFFSTNADYWTREFHLDGFRLDATQQIYDTSPVNIMAEISTRARRAAGDRQLWIIAENEPQDVRLLRPVDNGGCGLDALWNDDFHHSARVAVTGRAEAYCIDYLGRPQELLSSVKHGFLYQGQYYTWQKQRRGTPVLGLGPHRFIIFIQNHDQVANSARGLRLHELASPGRYRAITALLLLAPSNPMLFQGQEFAASAPFLYFADNESGRAEIVRNGRRDFMRQFASIAAGGEIGLADPGAPETYQRCKLDPRERETHARVVALHRDLIRLRHADPVFNREKALGIDGAVIGPEAFVLRYFGEGDNDRLVIINLGRQLSFAPMPEPLLAPPAIGDWKLIWSSEAPEYGGNGTPEVNAVSAWQLPAHAAVVLAQP